MKAIYISLRLTLCVFFLSTYAFAQTPLAPEDLLPYTTYFSLSDEFDIEGEAAKILEHEIQRHQFVGLGELHQSQLLSYFTKGLLNLLKQNGYNYFSMEVGPYSAHTLQEVSQVPSSTAENIKRLNKRYGNKLLDISPMVFADKEEDAVFLEKASELGFEFWGLDQEFFDSFELHLDAIYGFEQHPNSTLEQLYLTCKSKIRKWNRKAVLSRKFNFTCSLQEDEDIQSFFAHFKENKLAQDRIHAVKVSWEIYCKNERGLSSNQDRGDYMKANFDSLYVQALQKEANPKVFVKLGSVHLSKGTSIFRVDDMGKHLHEKAVENQSSFLNIRHLRRYRNGKDLIGSRGWESVGLLMKVGKKEEWTLTDLRPLRERLLTGELTADKNITYELKNYDFLLIPPNDKKAKANF